MIKKLIILEFLLVFLSLLMCQTNAQLFSDREIILKTIDYKLNIRIHYENEKLSAECSLTLLNPSPQPITRIPLILYRLMKVTSVKDAQDTDLSFSQQIIAFEDWEKLQVNYIEVFLKNPIQPGGRYTIKLQYEGYLYGYTEVGMLYVKDSINNKFTIIRPDCFAYPQVGYPSWKVIRAAGLQSFDYLIKLTVPDQLIAANGGRLINKVTQNGTISYTYQNIKPAWRIDVAIAKYGILEDSSNKVKIFYFQEDKKGAKMVSKAMKGTLELYKSWFGLPESYGEFSIIEIPEGYGSQADTTCILQTRDAFVSEDHLYQLYHEISHMWNVPALDPLPARFESEGLAMFLQYFVQEKLENKTGSLEKAVVRLSESFRKECQSNPRCKDVPMIDYGKEGLTDLSYSKGMIFFYVLYNLIGEGKFLETIKSFYEIYHQSGATSKDFIDHLKKSSEIDLTNFFQDWIYRIESSQNILDQVPINSIVKKYLPHSQTHTEFY